MRALGHIAMVLAVVVAGATIAATLGGMFWGFDLLANFRLQYALAAVPLAAVLAAAHRPGAASVMVVAALFNGAVIAPMYLRSPQPHNGGETVSVVAFNIQLSSPNAGLGWILETDPDVVFIFESSRQAEEALAGMNLPYELFSAIDDNRLFGPTVLIRRNATATKLPISDGGGDGVRVELSLAGQQIAVYGIHPPSPVSPERALARDRFLRRAGAAIAAETIPVVVAGDLNATPWTEGFRLLTGPADLVNSQEGFGYSPTWPTQLPSFLRIPLDHVLHSRELTVTKREIGPRLSSDHNPIRVELGFATPLS